MSERDLTDAARALRCYARGDGCWPSEATQIFELANRLEAAAEVIKKEKTKPSELRPSGEEK